MKQKLAVTILLFFILIGNVSAKEEAYYSSYSDYSAWQQERKMKSDTIDVEVERRYRWYYEEKEYGDYVSWDTKSSEFPFLDSSDIQKTEWSKWQDKKPDDIEKREIQKEKLYQYQKIKKVRYVYLYDMQGSDGNLSIPEIEILYDKKKVKYSVVCASCAETFTKKLNDGNIYDIDNKISNGSLFILDMGKFYDIENIVLNIYLYDTVRSDKYITYSFTDQITEDPIFFTKNRVLMNFQNKNQYDIFCHETTWREYLLLNPSWDEIKYSKEEITPTTMTKVKYDDFYRYRDTYYRQYQIHRYETENYSAKATLKYKEKIEDDYQDWYRYRTRDKVVLSGNYIIQNHSFRLEDFVLKKTRNVQILGEINLKENGTYNLVFDLGFQKIKKKIIVDILENDIRKYKALEEKEHQINQQLQNIEQSTEITENIQKQKEQLQKKQKNIFAEKEKLKEKISPKVKNNDLSFPKIYFYFTFFFLLLLIIYLGKRHLSHEKG